MIVCFLQLCYYRIPLITKNVNHASLLSWHLFYFILTFYFILFLFAPEDISGLRSNNVLEERDPEYDAMLNKMLGRITTKPGGKLEMGEVRTFKQTKKKRKWARWCYKRPLVFVFQYAICHKQVLWTYDTSTTNGLLLDLDIFNCDFFMLPLKLMALSLFNILRRI